ncbi:MAG: efflux RND transporter periplasmic adaptor subunit [Bacteroidales bacterium]|nr:MAG: efflux RND transporter periplasmic adaptor subunit [Bacteroidales bacterium]
MKKVFRILLIVILVGGGILVFVYLAGKNKKAPVVFETQSPFVTDIIKKTVATGSIVPRKEIEIKSTVPGIIEEIFVEPGQMVKQGDLVARVRVIPEMRELNSAEARLKQAKIKYEDARKVHNRQKKLFDDGIIPELEFQQYLVAFDNAKTELEAADNNLQIIKEGVTKSKGTTNTLIRSTITGMILDVPVEIGNTVIHTNSFNPGTTIASVANMNNLIFEGKLDESEVGKIKLGMQLLITVGAIENVTFNATLEHISPKGFEENGTILFPIKADVELIDTLFIRAGYSANASIVLGKRDSVLAISESLLQFEGDNDDSVFVEIEKDPQQFEKKYIEVGLSDGINIEVKSGLSTENKIKVPQGG